MDKLEFRTFFKGRTKEFALKIVQLYQKLPKTGEAQVIGRQLLRSATSVAANYRAACRARSGKELYSKLCIVVEEADESQFWLELLEDAKVTSVNKEVKQLADEVVKISTKAKFTAGKKLIK